MCHEDKGKRHVKECLSIQKQGTWDVFQRISRAALILIWQPPLTLFLRPSERERGEACTSKRETGIESKTVLWACTHACACICKHMHARMQAAQGSPAECLGHNSLHFLSLTAQRGQSQPQDQHCQPYRLTSWGLPWEFLYVCSCVCHSGTV